MTRTHICVARNNHSCDCRLSECIGCSHINDSYNLRCIIFILNTMFLVSHRSSAHRSTYSIWFKAYAILMCATNSFRCLDIGCFHFIHWCLTKMSAFYTRYCLIYYLDSIFYTKFHCYPMDGWQINISPVNCLILSFSKTLPEAMLTKIFNVAPLGYPDFKRFR